MQKMNKKMFFVFENLETEEALGMAEKKRFDKWKECTARKKQQQLGLISHSPKR
jgi:hypothetical protein